MRYNLLAVPVDEQETFISKSLQKILKGNVKKSLSALKEEQKAVEQQIKEPHGRPRHPSRPSAERIVRSDGLRTRHRASDRDGAVDRHRTGGPATKCRPSTSLKSWLATRGLLRLSTVPARALGRSAAAGKTKVSHQARKRLKSLLHMGTMSAIQMKGDLQDYYVRKLGEGKHTMLVLNAVRNNGAARAADSPSLCRCSPR